MDEIQTILNSTDVKYLELQIAKRQDLISKMVGNLYPAILNAEIERIEARIEELKVNDSEG